MPASTRDPCSSTNPADQSTTAGRGGGKLVPFRGSQHIPPAGKRRRTPQQQRKLALLEETRQFREHLGDPSPLPTTIQAIFHWDRSDQVETLTEARLAEADLGFIMRLLAVCTLPRTDPGNQRDYRRVNGPYRLYMTAGPESKLPFGNAPRLMLAWICTEVTRTGSRTLRLGRSLAQFMEKLGMESDSGGPRGDRTRLREQMNRLFDASIHVYEGPLEASQKFQAPITDIVRLWWHPKEAGQTPLWETEIILGERFYNEIVKNPMPIDMHVLKAMKRSPLGLDLYLWATAKLFRLKRPFRIKWERLYDQFGPRPGARDNQTINSFRTAVLREFVKMRTAWPELDFTTPRGALELRPTPPLIPPAPEFSTDPV